MTNTTFVLLLGLVVLCSSTLVAHGDGGDADAGPYLVIETSSMKPKAACSGHKVPPSGEPSVNSTWAPVHQLSGPCSPAYSGTDNGTTDVTSMAEMLDADQRRATYIQKRLAGATNDMEPTRLKTMATSNSAPVGTSAVTQTVVVDTGSDLPWVQCKPCPLPACHRQVDPLFDPTRSTTYAAIPCNSAACAQLGPYRAGCSANGQCQFLINYGDGSTATGTYSTDDLTLGPYEVIRGFRFGCAHADRGGADNYEVARIMGLGGGSQSLVQQTVTQFSRVFSYCLPPTASSLGYLVLGVPPERARLLPFFVSTPLLSNNPLAPTFYRVLLRAIIVAGHPLPVPPAVFSASSVVDSATVISRLPPTAYQALRAAFRGAMTMYRPAPPVSVLDTCYDFTGVRSVTLPSIALVFDGGATVNLDASGILLGSCLAFAPTASDRIPGIIGNVQQRTLEVVYDVPGKAMRFRSAAC